MYFMNNVVCFMHCSDLPKEKIRPKQNLPVKNLSCYLHIKNVIYKTNFEELVKQAYMCFCFFGLQLSVSEKISKIST